MDWARVMRGMSSMEKAEMRRALSAEKKSPSECGSSMPISRASSRMAFTSFSSGRRTHSTTSASATAFGPSGAMNAPASSYSASEWNDLSPAPFWTTTSRPSFT